MWNRARENFLIAHSKRRLWKEKTPLQGDAFDRRRLLQGDAFARRGLPLQTPLCVANNGDSFLPTVRHLSFLSPRFCLFDVLRQLLSHFAIGHYPASPNAPGFRLVQMGTFGGEHRLVALGGARVNLPTFACLLSCFTRLTKNYFCRWDSLCYLEKQHHLSLGHMFGNVANKQDTRRTTLLVSGGNLLNK